MSTDHAPSSLLRPAIRLLLAALALAVVSFGLGAGPMSATFAGPGTVSPLGETELATPGSTIDTSTRMRTRMRRVARRIRGRDRSTAASGCTRPRGQMATSAVAPRRLAQAPPLRRGPPALHR